MIKHYIGKIHLWLGFTSGLIVFIVAITGCILAFQQEIELVTKPYQQTVTPANAVPLPPAALGAIARGQIPDKHPNGINYMGKGKSATVQFYGGDPEYYYQVFLDPYTGKVLKVWNEEGDFFHFILHGHYYVWLPPAIGQPVVATATIMFVVMLISGLILWWPKNKSAAKQRFSVRFNARWRRVNYDLHNVLGFYAITFGLILALTGLVWGFEWFSKSLYFVTSGGKPLPPYEAPLSDTTGIPALRYAEPVDQVWQQLLKQAPKDAGIYISYPDKQSDAISASVNYRPGTYYKTDNYYFDRNTLALLPAEGPYTGKYADAGFADKLRAMNYDIHVGAILGIPGKILMFTASLVFASLPVTGIYIWWGRRHKKKRVPPKQKAVQRVVMP